VISRATSSFWQALAKLKPADGEAAQRAFRLFSENPSHNSLYFKKLAGHRDLWSARVNLNVRAVAHRDGELVTWAWIGTHAEFDQLFG
jgi:hypothetical protein